MEKNILGLTEEELSQVEEDIDMEGVEDFDLVETPVTYEVWILGYDAEMNATDFEVLVDDGYTELVEAQKCFEYMADVDNLKPILDKVEIPTGTKHLHLFLEMCTSLPDGSTECQDVLDEIEIF